MEKIIVKRHDDFDYRDYVRRSALESDYKTLIKKDCKIYDEDTGELIIVYFVAPKMPASFIRAVTTTKTFVNRRTHGLYTTASTFGYRPREKIRNDFCSSSMMSVEQPKRHKIICDFATEITKYYKKYCGITFKKHEEIAKTRIDQNWRLGDTPFSSGIVNRDSQLKYHHDSGNFSNVYSNMVSLKSNVKGGHLAIPEYDIGLEIANNSILLFDGQKIMHGVTPIKKLSEEAYRCTVVYYTLKQMWQCKDVNTELNRYRKNRTKIEQNRFDILAGRTSREKIKHEKR